METENKYDAQAEIVRLRSRVERLRGAIKTASGWCFDMTSDDNVEYDWLKRADLMLEYAGDMEPERKMILRHDLVNLLRETLPYLQRVENSTQTSVVLRALIEDIKRVTKDGNDKA